MSVISNLKRAGAKGIAIAIAASFVATTALPVTVASAHDVRHYHEHHHHQKHYSRKKKRRSNKGDVVAAGIIGLAIGAMIAGSQRHDNGRVRDDYRDDYYNRDRRRLSDVRDDDYYSDDRYDDRGPIRLGEGDHRREREDTRVITYEDATSAEPWTVEWFRYCENKYRSFNADDGTFMGYDGKRRFCVAR